MIKRVIQTPVFNHIREFFTGDNVLHYLPAKYLWTVCNVKETGFYQPVYDSKLEGPIAIDFMCSVTQPQHKYFQKPPWINKFIVAENDIAAKKIIGTYDLFVNNYRFRGGQPLELNWGYFDGMPSIDLYAAAYAYKAVYEQGLSLDDLILSDEYGEFLQSIKHAVNPDRRPLIVLHCRGNDRWKRHLPNASGLSEVLLRNLLDAFPEHQIVLLGESWRYHRHPRIRYLDEHLNLPNLRMRFKDYSACLKFILSAYFCRDAEMMFCGLSGFSMFVAMIRPFEMKPIIPLFWGVEAFSGIDTCTQMFKNWGCSELSAYRKTHSEDEAFHHDTLHFLYYSREAALLKPYCLDYPNNPDKVFALLKKVSGVTEHQIETQAMSQSLVEMLVTCAWRLRPCICFFKRVWQIVFIERALVKRLRLMIKNLN